MSDDGNFWTGVLITAALAGGLYYCTREDPAPEPYLLPGEASAVDAAVGAGDETTTEAAIPLPPVTPPKPQSLFDEKDGYTYYYTAAVSEEERKKGTVSGLVLSFQYGGKNDSGEHIVFRDGIRYTCSVPCKIIKVTDGRRIAFSTESMIGAVFLDAMRGYLKAAPKPKPQPQQVNQEPWTGYKDDLIPPESSGGYSEGLPQGKEMPTEVVQ